MKTIRRQLLLTKSKHTARLTHTTGRVRVTFYFWERTSSCQRHCYGVLHIHVNYKKRNNTRWLQGDHTHYTSTKEGLRWKCCQCKLKGTIDKWKRELLKVIVSFTFNAVGRKYNRYITWWNSNQNHQHCLHYSHVPTWPVKYWLKYARPKSMSPGSAGS